MESYSFTIQIQTNHFEKPLGHELESMIAQGVALKFEGLIEHRGMSSFTTYQATWMPGCIIENIVLTFQNLDTSTKAVSTLGTYIILKDYSDIRISVQSLLSDIRKFSFYVKNIPIKVVRVILNEGTSAPLKYKIDPVFDSTYDITDKPIDEQQ